MIKKLYKEILIGNDVRQNLSKIRSEIKKEEVRQSLIEMIGEDTAPIVSLLGHEDAKTRRNAVLLLGDLAENSCLDAIYAAYVKEPQRFVKSAYLSAMMELSYEKYLPQLKDRLKELLEEPVTVENKKHLNEEIRKLQELILEEEPMEAHEFRGYRTSSDLLLLTNREFVHEIAEEIQETLEIDQDQVKEMRAGIRLQTDEIREVMDIRPIEEVLFLVPGMTSCPFEPIEAGAQIAQSELLTFLEKRHKGKAPFYFRVELRSRMPLKQKSAFVKKLSYELEQKSERNLINSPNNYEVELRLVENKAGKLNSMVKLYTVPDERFSYRREFMPTSIKPVDAALLVALAHPYMKEDAQVLDPFCGVGTMLIERQKKVPANTSYGIERMGEAVEKARINTELAGQIIHYVNRDFFQFTHEYLFDEIFTNMPFAQGHVGPEEIEETYIRFFEKVGNHLKEEGQMILFSHDENLLRREALRHHYKIQQEFVTDKKKGTMLFLITREG